MTKYSKEIVKEICDSIEIGHTQKDAASLAGVTEETFYKWKRMKLADGTVNPEYHPEFPELLRQAHKRYKDKLLKLLHGAVAKKQDSRTTLEILARRYPAEWGEKLKLEVSIDPQDEIKKIDERIKKQWPETGDSTNSS
jgi:transposase